MAIRKHFMQMLALSMLASSLCACGGKSAQETAAQTTAPVIETTAEETNPENGLPLSKQPDPNAPVLATIIVFAPGADGEISEDMYAAEALTEENVLELLINCGTVNPATQFVSLETSASDETAAPGPGEDSSAQAEKGVLTLSGFAPGEGLDEETAKQAVADTFAKNYDLAEVSIILD